MKHEKSFCIIKRMTHQNSNRPLNVVLIDSNNEVLEFDTREEAENWAKILTQNSDSGWEYIVKEI